MKRGSTFNPDRIAHWPANQRQRLSLAWDTEIGDVWNRMPDGREYSVTERLPRSVVLKDAEGDEIIVKYGDLAIKFEMG